MLLRIVPLTAVVITLLALIVSVDWQPYSKDGLNGSNHVNTGLI